MSGYRQTYDQWRADPQAFWAKAAREIFRKLDLVFNNQQVQVLHRRSVLVEMLYRQVFSGTAKR